MDIDKIYNKHLNELNVISTTPKNEDEEILMGVNQEVLETYRDQLNISNNDNASDFVNLGTESLEIVTEINKTASDVLFSIHSAMLNEMDSSFKELTISRSIGQCFKFENEEHCKKCLELVREGIEKFMVLPIDDNK